MMKSSIPHCWTEAATMAAHPQKSFGLCAVAGRPYSASTTWIPSACARGAARTRNGSSVMCVGSNGLNWSVQRSSVRFAPFSIVSNQAPPSSAYLPVSSATPYWIGGMPAAFAPLGTAVLVAPAAPAPTSTAQQTPIKTLTVIRPPDRSCRLVLTLFLVLLGRLARRRAAAELDGPSTSGPDPLPPRG